MIQYWPVFMVYCLSLGISLKAYDLPNASTNRVGGK